MVGIESIGKVLGESPGGLPDLNSVSRPVKGPEMSSDGWVGLVSHAALFGLGIASIRSQVFWLRRWVADRTCVVVWEVRSLAEYQLTLIAPSVQTHS
jgi:hypothetical protein